MDIALSRTQTSDPVTRRQALFAWLDSLSEVGQSYSCVVEAHNQGARESFLVYCALHSIDVSVSEYSAGNHTGTVWRAVMPCGAIVEVQA